MARTRKIGSRHAYYLREIEAALDAARLGPRQRERVMEPGWTKVRLYARLLSRDEDSVNHYEKWTAFAVANPTEVVKQAAARGRPSVPRDQRVQTILFRLPVGVRDDLIEALKLRGWSSSPTSAGGGRGTATSARCGCCCGTLPGGDAGTQGDDVRIKLTFLRVTAVLALAYPLSRSLDIVQMLRVRDYGSVAVLLGVSGGDGADHRSGCHLPDPPSQA